MCECTMHAIPLLLLLKLFMFDVIQSTTRSLAGTLQYRDRLSSSSNESTYSYNADVVGFKFLLNYNFQRVICDCIFIPVKTFECAY